MKSLQDLEAALYERYEPQEWPSLRAQIEQWKKSRPLQGLRVLDATPLFFNTLAKHLALLSAGAELIIPQAPLIPGDARCRAHLHELGVHSATVEELQQESKPLDLILDCAGQHASLSPRLGSVELTRSGLEPYKHSAHPVIIADSGRIKLLETALGTGEGFFRALEKLGLTTIRGGSLVVVGLGKVGRGVIHAAMRRGLHVCGVDRRREAMREDCDFLPLQARAAVQHAMHAAWCVVTVTGVKHALRPWLDLARLEQAPCMLANLGVEDEYGPEIPDDRVLFNKKPLNFILDEPTPMRYIEGVMALHNACALELCQGNWAAGCHEPPAALEYEILACIKAEGRISPEEWAWLSKEALGF